MTARRRVSPTSDDDAKPLLSPAVDGMGNARTGSAAASFRWVAACVLGVPVALTGLLCFSVGSLLLDTAAGLLEGGSLAALLALAATSGPSDGGWDAAAAGAVATALSALIGVAAPRGAPWARYLRTLPLAGAVGYSLAAGARAASGSRAATACAVAVALPLLQAARVWKLWRHASPQCAAAAERRMLECVLSHGRATFTQGDAACGMHYVRVERAHLPHLPAASAQTPLVIVHGYMAGSAFFVWQLEELVQTFGVVFAVDWPGCGASSRDVPFSASSTHAAEEWALAPFEAWRAEMRIERMFLLGHSLGGYLSGCYALRHPQRVAHLVLASPAGIADKPAVGPAATVGRRIPPALWGLAAWLWERDVTPGVMLRLVGPLGPAWVRTALGFRISRWALERPLDGELQSALGAYMYHNVSGDGSGEYMLRHLLRPGVWAKAPIGPRLVAAAREGRCGVPTLLCYGAPNDWMDKSHGDALVEQLRGAGVTARSEAVGPAGHHLYLEAPTAFNALVVEVLLGREPAAAGESGGAAAMPSL